MFILLMLLLNLPLYPYSPSKALQVFRQIQSKTGQWNINIKIVENGKSVLLDKSNTIFLPEKIIELCYSDYSETEGNNRLAFLLSHEFAHIMNNDLDYDRILNPFNKKLSNESIEIRKQKEINADLRAISIMNISGFTTGQFEKQGNNIITDLYKLYGINTKAKKSDSYPAAAERVNSIIERRDVLAKYNKLYEMAVYFLLFSNENSDEYLCDYAIQAFESYINYTSLSTASLLNNLGLCYLKSAKNILLNNFENAADTLPFCKFESGFIISSVIKQIRGSKFNSSISLREKIEMEKERFNTLLNKAYHCFKEASEISEEEFIPAQFNKIVLLGLMKKYDEAKETLNSIKKKNTFSQYNALFEAYFYNLAGIVEYCLGNKQEAVKDFDKTIELNPDYLTGYKNKEIAVGRKQDKSQITREKNNGASLAGCIYNSFGRVSYTKKAEFPFGPREAYSFSYFTADSIQMFSSEEKEAYRKINFIKLSKGRLYGMDFRIGSKKEDVLKRLPKDYSILFSDEKIYYYYKNQGIFFSFLNNGSLAEIVVIDKQGAF